MQHNATTQHVDEHQERLVWVWQCLQAWGMHGTLETFEAEGRKLGLLPPKPADTRHESERAKYSPEPTTPETASGRQLQYPFEEPHGGGAKNEAEKRPADVGGELQEYEAYLEELKLVAEKANEPLSDSEPAGDWQEANEDTPCRAAAVEGTKTEGEEKSLAEALQQICETMQDSVPRQTEKELAPPTADDDEWTGDDDIGFICIPAPPQFSAEELWGTEAIPGSIMSIYTPTFPLGGGLSISDLTRYEREWRQKEKEANTAAWNAAPAERVDYRKLVYSYLSPPTPTKSDTALKHDTSERNSPEASPAATVATSAKDLTHLKRASVSEDSEMSVERPCAAEEATQLSEVGEEPMGTPHTEFSKAAEPTFSDRDMEIASKAHSPTTVDDNQTKESSIHDEKEELAAAPTQTQPQLEKFDLEVIYEKGKTGFEESQDFPVREGHIIAGRYQIVEYIGSAAFSHAVQCLDLKYQQYVCVKIIKNSKDFFDQSLDEIKLLQYINRNGDADENCVLQLYDYFYYKEHLFLISELLRDNLYEFSKYNRQSGHDLYFTIPRLQKITKQILVALAFIHRLDLMHCDLKPENILIRSFSRCEVKLIDFGSSCFTRDHLSSYVQSRCYRAPEVILGLHYGQKIDLWSLGAVLPELYTGQVIFHNDSVNSMLARIVAICGPIPSKMLREARHAAKFLSASGVFYEKHKTGIQLLYPKKTTLKKRMGNCDDELFVDFVSQLLQIDADKRPTAMEALQHPWLQKDYGPIPPP